MLTNDTMAWIAHVYPEYKHKLLQLPDIVNVLRYVPEQSINELFNRLDMQTYESTIRVLDYYFRVTQFEHQEALSIIQSCIISGICTTLNNSNIPAPPQIVEFSNKAKNLFAAMASQQPQQQTWQPQPPSWQQSQQSYPPPYQQSWQQPPPQ